MKKSILVVALAALPLFSSLALAAEPHHSDKGKATAMTDKDKQMQMNKIQEHMLKMHEQMHKIMDSKDAGERDKLMQEHSKMMQDSMRMMHEMKGEGMKDHGMMDGMKKM